jgi:HNH endonuclease
MDNYIKRFYDKEEWAKVELKTPFVEKFEMHVSNYGIVKRITKETGESRNVLQILTEGYPCVNIYAILPIEEKYHLIFTKNRKEIKDLEDEIKRLKAEIVFHDTKTANYSQTLAKIEETKALLDKVKSSYKRRYKKYETKRRRTFGNLVHRLVATAFVEKPSEKHNLVAHLDYNKHNNHHSNLKWMTREENVKHQLKSPFVIQSKIVVANKKDTDKVTNAKLTISEVMILKKRMNEGVALRILAKRYAVTETQLLRIKRGENWAKVPAAL